MQEFKIGPNEAGQRLDKFLHKYLKEANTGFLHKMLRKKNITLNKKKADGKEMLVVNDQVQFFFSEETFQKFRGGNFTIEEEAKVQGKKFETNKKQSLETDKKQQNSDIFSQYDRAYQNLKGIEIIYENEHILLVNKPAGILSQKSLPSDVSVNEWFIGYLLNHGKISKQQLDTFKPSICNRLDRNTSGLMICGKSLIGTQTMNSLIKTKEIRKFYRTFVKGSVTEGAYIQGFLKKDESLNKVSLKKECELGKEKEYVFIETGYRPMKCIEDYTYLEVELLTGKTHQIRAHLASIGHPLLGDEKYGDRKWNREFQKVKIPNWQLLHSYRLEFPKMEGIFEDLSCRKFTANEPSVYETLKK